MLTSLYLKNFAIVNEAELSLRGGMTSITGETGAGKSILIDALNLVLGGRSGPDVIRHDEAEAEIIAGFDLSTAEKARRWLTENGLQSDDDCLLRRIIRREGNSRGYINGRPVTMQQLRELGDELVDIHGQHEHQSLLRADAQRQILDEHAGHREELQMLAGLFDDLQDTKQHLERLLAREEDGVARIDLLRYQVDELDAAGISREEIQLLEGEHRRLANASDLIQGGGAVLGALSDDEDHALDRRLGACLADIQALEQHDPSLAEVSRLVAGAGIQIDEAVAQIRHYIDRLELDPGRLAELEQRIAVLHDLARKHRVSSQDLPAQHEQLKAELAELESGEERVAQLQEQVASLTAQCTNVAERISKQRVAAARLLAKDVTARMQELGMQGGSFSIAVRREGPLRRHGLDYVEYLVAGNPGQTPLALKRVASGGELSRIALALQVTATENTSIPTLVFDEIDVGIGGRVAEIVGRQLHRLGATRQVLCITHLAQVASYAEQQLRISKSGEPVQASIEALEPESRIEEIARMLGGIEITEQTRAHAREMLERAAS
jgi:DNA repair protein RecN (Recombination protein N)